MMHGSPREQALLAGRWVDASDEPLWSDFPRYWMAFNALYNGVREEGEPEAGAVTKVIQLFFDAREASACLGNVGPELTGQLTVLPPGDDRLDPRDPAYRRKCAALVERFKNSPDPVEQLAALMGIVYQVRCNLLHGSKDPAVMRDQELITTCTPILKIVEARLRRIMMSHDDLPRP